MLQVGGLPFGGSIVFGALGQMKPAEELGVAEWADKYRVISEESGSPNAGQWETDRAPYLREPMECCGVDHPAPRVAIRGSAQGGKSEVLVNAALHCVDTAPRSIMVLTPSLSKAQAWNREKWEPTIEATERVRLKVMATTSRSKDESTTFHKRFRGGFLKIVTASSAKELQSSTIGLLILEEPTDYPADAGSRGDPIDQARHRLDAWGDDGKEIGASTPGEVGSCRISAMYEAGDQRKYFVPCPHCGDLHSLEWEAMLEDDGRPVFACPSCGAFIEETALGGMLAGGAWVKCFVSDDPDNPAPPRVISPDDLDDWRGRPSEGRYPSFHFWQAYSPFSTWRKIRAEWREAKEDPVKLKTFYQQVLAEPFEAARDKPSWEALRDAMEGPALRRLGGVVRGEVPIWAAMLTGAADVQGDRIEWAVYAWGPEGRGARIDNGIIPINPSDKRAWQELGRVRAYEYEGPHFESRPCDRFGVDSGGHHTQEAYRFCRASGVLALKGKPNDPDAPPLSLGNKAKVRGENGRKIVGRVSLHLVGTHLLKASIYYGLHQALVSAENDGDVLEPGALLLSPDSVEGDYKQITAEHIVEDVVRGRRVSYWDKPKHQANEQLDLAVYAKALALSFGLDRLSAEGWSKLFAERAKDTALADALPLERLMLSAEPPAGDEPVKPARPSWAEAMKELNKNG